MRPCCGRVGRRCRRGCSARAAAPVASPVIRPADTAVVSTRRVLRARRSAATAKTRSSRSTARRRIADAPRRLRRAATGPSQGAESAGPRPARSRPGPCRLLRCGWASATSACWRIDATGVRSSWEASETNRRCRCWACSSRLSIWFMVRASLPISSSPGRSGTRRCSSAAEMESTSRRIASTGARARPTIDPGGRGDQEEQDRQPDHDQPRIARVDSVTPSVLTPTSRVRAPAAVSMSSATTR